MTQFFMYARNKQRAANRPAGMVHASDWLSNSCLHLSTNQTVSMFFTWKPTVTRQPAVFVKGEKVKMVSDLKYRSIFSDSKLTFKKHVK